MSGKSSSKSSRSTYSARTSSTGGNNHRGPPSSQAVARYTSTPDPMQHFFVNGTPSGRTKESTRDQLVQWDRRWAAASRR